MARYIDAEKLFEEIESLYVFLGGDNVFNKTAKESVLQKIDEQPTADVVEVKFGEWVFDDADEYGVTYKCSRCNDLILVRNKHSHKPNYCGNCGADMRGKKDG